MPTESPNAPRLLPARPNLRHLKDQARDLLRAGEAESVADAQFQIARRYGFASWAKLKFHVDSLQEVGELKQAIDTNDFERVKALMSRNPELHRAPLGYGKNGPLTWVAECRVPWEPPTEARLEMARWMIENGSDIHQGGDGPLMRAALAGYRVPMMELLVSYGADVNAEWAGWFPILFAPCETVEPIPLKWLLDHGADPNCARTGRDTAIDTVIGTYLRSSQLSQCIDILLQAGGTTRWNLPPLLDLLRNRLDSLSAQVESDRELLDRRFLELDFGASGARRLTLRGATLLHVAAEYGNLEAATMLLDRGADVNARADVDAHGVGGQTPIYHAATQHFDSGLPMVELLLKRGADLSVRAKLPGHYERPEEWVECTPAEYAGHFPGSEARGNGTSMVTILRQAAAGG
jgi:ankyrin repeat protein